ncbi:MAG: hypothetical protein NVSMB21_23950 [Vulcanimicrobiaceae bacterium]
MLGRQGVEAVRDGDRGLFFLPGELEDRALQLSFRLTGGEGLRAVEELVGRRELRGILRVVTRRRDAELCELSARIARARELTLQLAARGRKLRRPGLGPVRIQIRDGGALRHQRRSMAERVADRAETVEGGCGALAGYVDRRTRHGRRTGGGRRSCGGRSRRVYGERASDDRASRPPSDEASEATAQRANAMPTSAFPKGSLLGREALQRRIHGRAMREGRRDDACARRDLEQRADRPESARDRERPAPMNARGQRFEGGARCYDDVTKDGKPAP